MSENEQARPPVLAHHLVSVLGLQMASKRQLLIPVSSMLALLLLVVALILFLPLPEERGFRELSKVQIGPIHWDGVSVGPAADEINARILKASDNQFRVFVDPSIASRPDDLKVTLHFDESVSAAQCTRFLAELSGYYAHSTKEGVLLSPSRHGPKSWRKDVREWLRYHVGR